jgi:hypothetical protein
MHSGDDISVMFSCIGSVKGKHITVKNIQKAMVDSNGSSGYTKKRLK